MQPSAGVRATPEDPGRADRDFVDDGGRVDDAAGGA